MQYNASVVFINILVTIDTKDICMLMSLTKKV